LLGKYTDASWSPHGLFVVVTRRHELLAVDTHGTVRWSIARRGPVGPARWAPDGYRIAYLDGSALQIVAGDGTGDARFAAAVAHVAPAWRPSRTHEHVLAFVSANRELELYATDEVVRYAQRRLPAVPRQLLWSSDGARLVALLPHAIAVFDRDGRPLGSLGFSKPAVTAAFASGTHRLAVLLAAARSDAIGIDVDRLHARAQELFSGTGRFSDLAWAPDGRWLLLAWPTADEFVFLHENGAPRIRAVSAIASQFDPRAAGGGFPTIDGWCCSEP
jgi:hypothetical protein